MAYHALAVWERFKFWLYGVRGPMWGSPPLAVITIVVDHVGRGHAFSDPVPPQHHETVANALLEASVGYAERFGLGIADMSSVPHPPNSFGVTAVGHYGERPDMVAVSLSLLSNRPEKQLAELETLRDALKREFNRIGAEIRAAAGPQLVNPQGERLVTPQTRLQDPLDS